MYNVTPCRVRVTVFSTEGQFCVLFIAEAHISQQYEYIERCK